MIKSLSLPGLSLLVGPALKPAISSDTAMSKRVPAEWESQEAVWLQWPGPYEKSYEGAFGKFMSIISEYQPALALLVAN